jgi:hypothetical protein
MPKPTTYVVDLGSHAALGVENVEVNLESAEVACFFHGTGDPKFRTSFLGAMYGYLHLAIVHVFVLLYDTDSCIQCDSAAVN